MARYRKEVSKRFTTIDSRKGSDPCMREITECAIDIQIEFDISNHNSEDAHQGGRRIISPAETLGKCESGPNEGPPDARPVSLLADDTYPL